MTLEGSRMHRRDVLRAAVGGGLSAGWGLALRALATGLPASILLRPNPGRAQSSPAESGPGRMLIIFSNARGDPVNANVPGTYGPGAEEVAHPPDPVMAETPLLLSGRAYTAAKPWADLPQSVLDNTVFFHHATYTPVHPDHRKVMALMGGTKNGEMLASIFSEALAPRQRSIQVAPLSLGAPSLRFRGQVLANVPPSTIARALGGAAGPLASLTQMRDETVDRIYSIYKEHGTKHDRALLDAWARSRQQVRSVSDALLDRLDAINNNSLDNQANAAAVLAAMNITPVLSVKAMFGDDNHFDQNLVRETRDTVAGVARMGRLMSNLESLRREGVLRHEVILATFSVFGRTLRHRGTEGRDHNGGHHVTVMMGPGLRGSVVGGIERHENDYRSTSIDSATGASGGDIPFEDSLGAMAKTLGRALGVDQATLDKNIFRGKPVLSALA